MADEFYIGYQKKAPKGIARWIRYTVIGCMVVALSAGISYLVFQNKFDTGHFEFTQLRHFEGTLYMKPYPVLVVNHPDSQRGRSQYLLVGFGKRGISTTVKTPAKVSLDGKLIYKDTHTMIEVADGSIKVADTQPEIPRYLANARFVKQGAFSGEIVGSKCFLGVMKPGRGKVHRSCAYLCIKGGIPPMLVTQFDGQTHYLIVIPTKTHTIENSILPNIAVPVTIKGQVIQIGTLKYLVIDAVETT